MNESHATDPTAAPPEHAVPLGEPEASDDSGVAPVEPNPELPAAAQTPLAGEAPAAAAPVPEETAPQSAAPEPPDDAAVASVEINPAAEPPPDAEPSRSDETPVTEAEPPPVNPQVTDALGDVAPVETNLAAEPLIAEPSAAEPPAAELPPAPQSSAAEAGAEAGAGAGTGTGEGAAADAAPAGEPSAAQAPAPAQPAAPKPPDPRAEERRQRAQQAWERVVNARESGEVLTGTVTAAVKGGLLVDVGGIRGFLPASQVRVPIGTALDTLVKTKVPLKVIDVDQGRRRIVVSHRRAAEEERRNKRAELLRSLEVGQVREGTVVRLADFGAFVDLGGVDGLIPMRELAFERIDKAGDVVTIGEKLQVEVLRIDENGKKISLSRKNALPDPWRDHANVLRQGSTVEGKVVAKEPRLQVEIAPGVVGSVRENDADPADYEIGEAIEVQIRRVDRATRRITLSTMHGAAAAPQQQQTSTSSGFAPLGVELGRRQ
jgi:predicted RNA-binding protein with RPS1 domain